MQPDQRSGRAGDAGAPETLAAVAAAVEKDRRRSRLNREISALEKKIQLERQFNRQIELNGELRRLQQELKGI